MCILIESMFNTDLYKLPKTLFKIIPFRASI